MLELHMVSDPGLVRSGAIAANEQPSFHFDTLATMFTCPSHPRLACTIVVHQIP